MIDGAGAAALMLVFLIALVLISRLRSIVSTEHRADLHLIAGGIAVLSLCELLVSLERSLALASIPFLSNALFLHLTIWILIITGSILIVAGMARWMPVIKKLNSFQENGKDNPMFMRLEQIRQAEHRPDEFFKRAFEIICHRYQIEQGIGLLHSNSERRFYPVVTLGGCSGEFLERIDKIEAKYRRTGKLKGHSVEVGTETGQFIHTFAIYAAGKLCGVYLLWAADEKLSHTMIRQIRTVCEIVGRAIDQSRLRITSNHSSKTESLRQQVSNISHAENELVKYVGQLSAILRGSLDSDYVSLSLFDQHHGLERISVGSNGSLLKESGLDALRYAAQATALFDKSQMVLIADSKGFNTAEYSRVLVNSGMRSIMAMQLERAGKPLGVLLVASHKAMRFSRLELSLLSSLDGPVRERLATEVQYRSKRNGIELQKRLNEFIVHLQDKTSALDPYQAAANLISDSLNVDLVRISLLDQTRRQLETKTEVVRRRLNGMARRDREFDLAVLPTHRAVVEQTIPSARCDQMRDISEEERAFWFDCLEAAILLPICSLGKVVGTISIGHAQSLAAVGDDTEQQLQTLASILGIITDESEGSRSVQLNTSDTLIDRVNKERRVQVMRSSLSGILGSLEMINDSVTMDEIKKKKFLEIIDRSARKLERNLELTH